MHSRQLPKTFACCGSTRIIRRCSPAKVRIGAVELTASEPPMFYFRDPAGNTLLIVEPG